MKLFSLLVTFVISAYAEQHIINTSELNSADDDYCDDVEGGNDENITSACSYWKSSGSGRFICTGSQFIVSSIPTSRVGDGICDCCDGDDERGSLWHVSCPDTCLEELTAARQQALQAHAEIKDGREIRSGLKFATTREAQMKENAGFQAKKDLAYLVKGLLDLRSLYANEYQWEAERQFKLLRERLDDYATGQDETLNLWGNAGPASLRGSHSPWETVPRKSNATLNSMSVRDRLRQSQCHFEMFRDETKQNHASVGKYVQWMKSSSGKSYTTRRTTTVKAMRERALFGKFLEHGEQGHKRFKMLLCEVVGVVIFPLTYAIDSIETAMSDFWLLLLGQAQGCTDNDTCPTWAKAISARWIKSVEKATGFPKALDYQRSRYIVNYVTTPFKMYTRTARWMLRIIWAAPYMYYGYYFDSSKFDILPKRRQACLCLEGMKVAQSEMKKVEKHIADFEAEKKYERALRTAQKGGRNDFGDGIWKAMRKKEITARIGPYTYRLEFFGDLWQDEILLGTFANWGTEKKILEPTTPSHGPTSSDIITTVVVDGLHGIGKSLWNMFDYAGVDMSELSKALNWVTDLVYKKQYIAPARELYNAQFFAGGDQCYNGPKRSAVLHYSCGRDHEIRSVTEIELCVYNIQVATPIACDEAAEERTRARLRELQVFGYSASEEGTTTINDNDMEM